MSLIHSRTSCSKLPKLKGCLAMNRFANNDRWQRIDCQQRQTRDTKTADVESLTSQRDELGADIGKLSQEIKDLAAAIAALDASVGEVPRSSFEIFEFWGRTGKGHFVRLSASTTRAGKVRNDNNKQFCRNMQCHES